VAPHSQRRARHPTPSFSHQPRRQSARQSRPLARVGPSRPPCFSPRIRPRLLLSPRCPASTHRKSIPFPATNQRPCSTHRPTRLPSSFRSTRPRANVFPAPSPCLHTSRAVPGRTFLSWPWEGRSLCVWQLSSFCSSSGDHQYPKPIGLCPHQPARRLPREKNSSLHRWRGSLHGKLCRLPTISRRGP